MNKIIKRERESKLINKKNTIRSMNTGDGRDTIRSINTKEGRDTSRLSRRQEVRMREEEVEDEGEKSDE